MKKLSTGPTEMVPHKTARLHSREPVLYMVNVCEVKNTPQCKKRECVQACQCYEANKEVTKHVQLIEGCTRVDIFQLEVTPRIVRDLTSSMTFVTFCDKP